MRVGRECHAGSGSGAGRLPGDHQSWRYCTSQGGGMEIARFDKNKFEEIRVSFDEWKGNRLLNLRVWFKHQPSGEWRPSNKGLAVPLHCVVDLHRAVAQAVEIMTSKSGVPE